MPIKGTFSAEIGEGFDKFKEFEKLFVKYRDALGTTPSAYAVVTKEGKEQEKALKGMTAAIIAQMEVMAKESRLQENMEQSTKRTASYWSSIQSSTRSAWGHISSIAHTVRNNAIVTGLLGLGGLWGLDRLAGGAANQRRTATGLGMAAGDVSAFGLTYNRAIDAQGLLSSISTARGDLGSAEASSLMTLGISPAGGATAIARQVLQKIYQLSKNTPEGLLGPLVQEGYGAGALGFSIQDLRRLKGMDQGEFDKYSGQFNTRSNQLGISDSTLRKWQDFVTTLDTTGKRIESSLIRGLVNATGPLEKLSEAAATFFDKLMGSGLIDQFVNKLSGWLDTFANYLGTDKFKQDARDIAAAFAQIAEWGMKLARWIGTPSTPGTDHEANRKADNARISNWLGNQWNRLTVKRLPDGTAIEDVMPQGFTPTGSSILDKIAGLEGSPDRNGVPQVSPAGAIGKYQIMPSTAAGYGVTADQLKDPATNRATAEKILADLSKRYNGNTAEILAAYNAGPMIADYLKAHGDKSLPMHRPDNGGDWDYRQTQAYLKRAGFEVTIDNPAGASITTQTTMAGGSLPGSVP